MKYCLSLTFVVLCAEIATAQRAERITDLQGCLDTNSVPQLFYRVAFGPNDVSDIRHLSPLTGTDSLFLAGHDRSMLDWVNTSHSVTFATFDCDPSAYLAVYRYCDVECTDGIRRYDDAEDVFYPWGKIDNIFIADSGRVYASLFDYTTGSDLTVVSRDSGATWPNYDDLVEGTYQADEVIEFPLTSVSPFDETLMFSRPLGQYPLLRSTDGGKTWETALDPGPYHGTVHFDSDAGTVYMLDNRLPEGVYRLLVSPALGERGSWVIAHEAVEPLILAVDASQPGSLVLAEGATILRSHDHGRTFESEHDHHRSITGLFQGASCTYFSDEGAAFAKCGDEVTALAQVAVGLPEGTILPESVEITAYPNPFSGRVTLSFPRTGHERRDFEVVDVSGRVVALIKGSGDWPGTESVHWTPSRQVAAGVYLVRPVGGKASESVLVVYTK